MFHVDLTPFGVDMERLKQERLERLQAAMAKHGLGALLLTDPLNIRYATNAVLWLNMRATAIQRYALVPVEGEPIIYERPLGKGRAGGDPKPGGIRSFNAFMFAMRPAAATEHFASQVADGLKELGVAGEPLGVDALNLGAVESLRAAGAAATDGWPALLEARRVKTVDEVQLIRWTTQTKFRGYDLVRETLAEMPASEDRLSRLMLDYLLDQGFEAGSEFIVIYDSSQMVDRPHSEPMGTDLVVAEGDLLICDATVAGPGGYYSDFARTYSRGTPSAENRARYQEAYATLQGGAAACQAGAVHGALPTLWQGDRGQAARPRRLPRGWHVHLRDPVAPGVGPSRVRGGLGGEHDHRSGDQPLPSEAGAPPPRHRRRRRDTLHVPH